MSQEQAKHENRDMNVGALITIVIGGAMLVLIIFIGMIAWLQTEINYVREVRIIEAPNPQLESLRSQQITNIEMRGVDAQGNMHIPIQDAMQIVVEKNMR